MGADRPTAVRGNSGSNRACGRKLYTREFSGLAANSPPACAQWLDKSHRTTRCTCCNRHRVGEASQPNPQRRLPFAPSESSAASSRRHSCRHRWVLVLFPRNLSWLLCNLCWRRGGRGGGSFSFLFGFVFAVLILTFAFYFLIKCMPLFNNFLNSPRPSPPSVLSKFCNEMQWKDNFFSSIGLLFALNSLGTGFDNAKKVLEAWQERINDLRVQSLVDRAVFCDLMGDFLKDVTSPRRGLSDLYG